MATVRNLLCLRESTYGLRCKDKQTSVTQKTDTATMIFSLFHKNLQGRGKLLSAWLLTLLFIPFLSFYGRSLQLFLLSNFSEETLGLYLGLLLAGIISGYTIILVKSGLHPHVYHLMWITALLLLLFQHIHDIEKMHIAIFGLFGFLSRKLFSLKTTIVCCVLVSFLDEIFQHFLANRVGDLRDVGINLFSSFLGLFLAFLLLESDRRNHSRGQGQL